MAEVIFAITSSVKDVCGKAPTERLFLDRYGKICLCLDEIVWKVRGCFKLFATYKGFCLSAINTSHYFVQHRYKQTSKHSSGMLLLFNPHPMMETAEESANSPQIQWRLFHLPE